MNWLKQIFSGSENKLNKSATKNCNEPLPQKDSNSNKVKIFEKRDDGMVHETAGNEALVGPLMEIALIRYRSVMSASRRNSIYDSDLDDLNECIGLLDKVIELWPHYGEPFALRGDMYSIRGQANRNSFYLDKAITDYQRAITVGTKDISNHVVWQNSIRQVKTIKNFIY